MVDARKGFGVICICICPWDCVFGIVPKLARRVVRGKIVGASKGCRTINVKAREHPSAISSSDAQSHHHEHVTT